VPLIAKSMIVVVAPKSTRADGGRSCLLFLNLEKKSPTDKYIISPSETNL